ncbi:MAG: hypothetical protein RL095_1952 [Verrucomicrobiota bacterium]|jgi:hypothetical protein
MHPAVKVLAVSLSLGTLGFLVYQAQQEPERPKKSLNPSPIKLSDAAPAAQEELQFFHSSKDPATSRGLESIDDSLPHGPIDKTDSGLELINDPTPDLFSSSKSSGVERIDESPKKSPAQNAYLYSSKSVSPSPPVFADDAIFDSKIRAETLYKEKKYLEAIAELEKILKVEPKNPEALALLKLCRAKLAPKQQAPRP